MNKFHTIALAALAVTGLSGAAIAQTVSGGDAYAQGFAAGAASQRQNSFDTFQTGVDAGKAQTGAGVQSFANGVAVGQAQAGADAQAAYNSGYHARAVEENDTANKAFDNGFRAGANEQAHLDDEFP